MLRNTTERSAFFALFIVIGVAHSVFGSGGGYGCGCDGLGGGLWAGGVLGGVIRRRGWCWDWRVECGGGEA